MALRSLSVPSFSGGEVKLAVDQSPVAAPAAQDAFAAPMQAVYPAVPIPTGKEVMTVSSTSVQLSSIPSNSSHALITVEGGDVRFWEDGSTPTATQGILMISGNAYEFTNLSALRFIKATDQADATLQVAYRRYV